MIEDPDCFVVMTLSGAMTIAKMGKVICTMLDRGMVQAIVSTGALMAHGMSEAVGQTHYKYQPAMDDVELFEKGYNRVYDTLEMELNLNHVEEVAAATLNRLDPNEPLSSEILNRELGRTLAEQFAGPGILKSAFLQGRPGLRSRVHGFRTGPRYVHLGHERVKGPAQSSCGTRR